MDAVHEFVARAVPLPRSDVDTDQIIPSEWLKRVERTGFGEGLFSEWRERSDFVLNQARYADAQILVAGPNFGTGSSREHAVWALNNALKQGLIPVTVPEAVAHTILAAVEDDAATEIVVDVVNRRVAVPSIGLDEPFELDDYSQHRLVEGLDDIGITERSADTITAFEAQRPTFLPSTA
jgi:3-isopropylmalate/(R)-2-methylmalate dehydratase small subunit